MNDTPCYDETILSTKTFPHPELMDPAVRWEAIADGKAMVVRAMLRAFIDTAKERVSPTGRMVVNPPPMQLARREDHQFKGDEPVIRSHDRSATIEFAGPEITQVLPVSARRLDVDPIQELPVGEEPNQ